MSRKNRNKKKPGKSQHDVHKQGDVMVASVVHRAGDTSVDLSHNTEREVSATVDDVMQKDVIKKKEGSHEHSHSHSQTHTEGHNHCQSPLLRKKVKNLISLLIIATGILCGALFVDVAQFFTQRGLSAKALGEARIVDYDGATWVKYDEPRVRAELYFSSHNSTETKEKVDTALSSLAFFMPTLSVEMIDIDSSSGQKMAQNRNIGYAPALYFEDSLRENPYYSHASDLFLSRTDGSYVLEMSEVDVPVEHFIQKPTDSTGMVIGAIDASVSVVVFENFLCEACAPIHSILTALLVQHPEKLKVVYKNIPNRTDEASNAGAYAGHCAYAQGAYDLYAGILFTNNAWKGVKPQVREDLFFQYGTYISSLDNEAFARCYGERSYQDQLTKDVTEANRLGIGEVPVVFVDGELFSYDSSENSLSGALSLHVQGKLLSE